MKATYQPKSKQRRRKHGFLIRMRKGLDMLKRRRQKGRWKLVTI